MVGVTVLYIALQVVSQGVLGGGLAQATVSPLADVAGASLGGWAASLLLAGASISMFGYLGGMTLSMPRMIFALARDGFLPRALAAVHPVYRSPQAAILAQSALTLVLAISGTFEKLAILANASVLALYLGCALAAWRLRQMGVEGGGAGPLRARWPPWCRGWRARVIVWLLTGLTADEWLGFCGVRRRGVDRLCGHARPPHPVSGLTPPRRLVVELCRITARRSYTTIQRTLSP